MGQITHRSNAGHSCATLQGMKRPLERGYKYRTGDISIPFTQRKLSSIQQLSRFLTEDGRHLGITFNVGGRIFRDCRSGLRLISRGTALIDAALEISFGQRDTLQQAVMHPRRCNALIDAVEHRLHDRHALAEQRQSRIIKTDVAIK